ncbi:hypothetical protein [Paenibacillus sp. NFR01]|uniref:hypothetical protein n=1 Tax=Paenibacillus sp. NFR01 TaxID=1566279 RepID=UPI0008B95BC5|nr:hypothetical protein [Paenibacillus sp. NFR01]SEU29627.1 hypothetical protein SAMN03159358_4809 [Paenibacillus sp. NFR01]
MAEQENYVLINAPTKAGEDFVRLLRVRGCRIAGLANNAAEKKRFEQLGIQTIIMVDTHRQKTWFCPQFAVTKVFLFEGSFALTCRYIQMCRAWTDQPIVVVTSSLNPRLVYKSLGADHVVYSHSGHVSFLAEASAMEG